MLAKEIAELELHIAELDTKITKFNFNIQKKEQEMTFFAAAAIGCVFGLLSLLF